MFEGLLFSIDLIGIPVALNMFGREKSKTIFGGVCSILFFGFVLWSVYNVGYEIISALNPKIVTFEYYQDDPRPITLSRENFPISFVLQMPTILGSQPFKDESIFKIDLTHIMIRRKNDEEGHSSEEWFVSKVYTEDCPRDYYSALESGLNDIDFDTSYCIAKEQPELEKLEVQGLFSSKNYQALEVQVSMCNNDTSPIPCASNETIKEYLSGSWFNAFYVNMVVNPQNYTNPNNTFKDLYYTMMNPNSYRETELSLGYVQIDTDSGWLTENFNTKSYTKVNSIKEFIDTSPRSDGVMMKCIIMSSQLETYYTRSYKKIQGVLAEAGGMANAVLVIMIFVVNPFMKLKFRESIMNEVFDIRMPQNRRGSRGNKKSKTCSIELSPDASPDNRNKIQGRSKTTLNLLKSEMFTNLNSTEEIKGQESGFLKSPLSPERQRLKDRDPEKKKSLFANSPGQSFTSALQLPREQERKDSIDLVLPINPINTKPPSYMEKPQETGEDKLENKKDEFTKKESGNYEDQLARLKSLKSDLKKKGRKLKLIDKNDSFKVKEKSLHDENSLHLSFPSNNSDVSDIEAGEKIVDVSPYEIVKSEQHKELEAENYQSGQEEEVIPKESQKKVPEGTKESIDKEKEKANGKNKIQLDTSIWDYVTEFMWKSGSRKKQKEAFKEGLKRIDERLDIINVMKKLREIDKLRALLLDPDQLVLFNNLPKPVIQLVDGSSLRRSNASVVQLETLQFVHEETSEEQIVDSINNLKNRADKSEIDRKLIEMFENESYS